MKNNAVISFSSSILISMLLSACSTTVEYQDEPSYYSLKSSDISVSYLALAFPSSDTDQLGLQLALVKRKKQAAKKERWLLLHDVPYQWLRVEWQGQQLYLLAAGPFAVGRELTQQRRKLQNGIGQERAMPAVATYSASDLQGVTQAFAKRSEVIKP
jgi:hypothetical protein